jgi:hypothetical protein
MKRFLLSLLTWLCLSTSAWAVPTFDVQSSATVFDALSFSWTHTIGGACSSNIVIVSIGFSNETVSTLSGVTVNGAAATQIDTISSTGSGEETLTTFYKVGATSGLVEATFTGSNVFGIGTARSYCTVHQGTPLGTPAKDNNDGTIPAPTVNVVSAAGELVIDSTLIISLPTTATAGSGQTERSNLTDLTEAIFRMVESDEAGAASVTMNWTLEAAHAWLTIGVSLKPAAASATTTRRRISGSGE